MIKNREEICKLYDKYYKLLPQSQRQAIFLCFFEDLSLTEASKILASSRSAIQNAIKKGVAKLIDINSKIMNN